MRSNNRRTVFVVGIVGGLLGCASALYARACWAFMPSSGCTSCSFICGPHYYLSEYGQVDIPFGDMDLQPHCKWYGSGTSYNCSSGLPPGMVYTCTTNNGTCCCKAAGDAGEYDKNVLTSVPRGSNYPQCAPPSN